MDLQFRAPNGGAIQAIGGLRREARDEIDRLIRFLDTTDNYVSRELEDSIDDEPHDDDELEPSLCGVTAANPNMPTDGRGDDRELEEGTTSPASAGWRPAFTPIPTTAR